MPLDDWRSTSALAQHCPAVTIHRGPIAQVIRFGSNRPVASVQRLSRRELG